VCGGGVLLPEELDVSESLKNGSGGGGGEVKILDLSGGMDIVVEGEVAMVRFASDCQVYARTRTHARTRL
jgi:hypothetical protein